jgi:hypothetical protein
MSKYHSKKLLYDGILFDSRKEARRYAQLKQLEKAGEIRGLQTQVEYELIPSIYEEVETGEYYKRGENKGKPKVKRQLLEHGVKYVADFVYTDKEGRLIVEDAKGFRTPEYVLKRKLMLYLKDIKISEI